MDIWIHYTEEGQWEMMDCDFTPDLFSDPESTGWWKDDAEDGLYDYPFEKVLNINVGFDKVYNITGSVYLTYPELGFENDVECNVNNIKLVGVFPLDEY